MQLPPLNLDPGTLPASGGQLIGWNLMVAGIGVSVACIGLIAFSFLRRKPKKEPEEEKAAKDPTPIEEWVEIGPAPHGGTDIDGLLSQVKYPLAERGRLVKALGGEDAEVEIGISRSLPAGEIADRCFSMASKFPSKGKVLEALDRASWITSVMSNVNMAPFPLRSTTDLPKGLARGYIEGVKVKDLLDRMRFPIENASDLLAELSEARFGRSVPTEGEKGRSQVPPQAEIPLVDGDEESEALLADAQVPGGEESDVPEGIPG